jgi:hypothetical protein
MSDKFDIDPQEVLMRASAALEAGWIKGAMRGTASRIPYGPKDDEGEDPRGVCVLGALDTALSAILDEQVRSRVPMPETMPLPTYEMVVRSFVSSATMRLQGVFRSVLEQKLNGLSYDPNALRLYAEMSREQGLRGLEDGVAGSVAPLTVPGWNDRSERRKSEVLALLKAVLDDVAAEILAEAEAPEPPASPEPQEPQVVDLRMMHALVMRGGEK